MKCTRQAAVTTAIFTTLLATRTVVAATVVHEADLAPLIAAQLGNGDQFGARVDIDNARIVVGTPKDDDKGADAGAAYVFDLTPSGWAFNSKIIAADGVTGDQFGNGAAVSGNRVALAAAFDDDHGNNSGSVYVYGFNGSTWTQQAKLKPSDAAANDNFGQHDAVALSGDRLLVGSRGSNGATTDSGAAYVFDYNAGSWSQTRKLQASDGAANDNFGFATALSGNRAVIGAHDANGSSGKAYIFDYSGGNWSQSKILTAPLAGVQFGFDVAVDEDTVVIGAWNDGADGSGAAYVYRFNGSDWLLDQKLTSDVIVPGAQFGASVDISGNFIVVGARNGFEGDPGVSYVFEFDGNQWTQIAALQASSPQQKDMFGTAVAISDYFITAGASANLKSSPNPGGAEVFAIPEPATLTGTLLALTALRRRSRQHA